MTIEAIKTSSPRTKSFLLAIAGIVVGIGILYLIGNLFIHFLEKNSLNPRKLVEAAQYTLTGSNPSGSGTLSSLGGSLAINDSSLITPATPNSSSTGTSTNSSTSSTSSSTGSGGSGSTPSQTQSTTVQPMIVMMPQDETNTVTPTPSNSNSTTPVPSTTPALDDSLTQNRSFSLLSGDVQPSLLEGMSAPVSVENPEILPDNPLYGVKEINRGLSNAMTFDPMGKTYNFLLQGNDKALEATTLLEKNAGESADQVAVKTFEGTSDLVKEAGKQIEKSIDSGTSPTLSLFNGMSNSLVFQQLMMLTAENLNDNDLSLKIEKIRVDHLVNTGDILTDVLNNSGNNFTVLSTLVNSTVNTPIHALQTLGFLNDLQSTVSTNVSPSIVVLQQALIEAVIRNISVLPQADKLNVLLTFAGNSPIRLTHAIRHLDWIQMLTENIKLRQLAHTGSELVGNKLESTLRTLPQEDQIAFFRHFVTGKTEDLKTLFVLEAHLRRKINSIDDRVDEDKLISELLTAKNDAISQIIAEVDKTPDRLENDPFVQRLLSDPDIYDLAVVQSLQKTAKETGKNSQALLIFSNARAIAVTNFVNDLAENEKKLLPIPYTATLLRDIDGSLTSKAQYIVNQGLQVYNNDIRSYTQPGTISTIISQPVTGAQQTTQTVQNSVQQGTQTVQNQVTTIPQQVIQQTSQTVQQIVPTSIPAVLPTQLPIQIPILK